MDGLEATSKLLTTHPDPPKVIVLTTFDADDLVLRALAAGAAGFLLKDTPPGRIIEAIINVHSGEQTLSPGVVAKVIAVATGAGSPRRDEARAKLEVLSERELQIALAIAEGLTNSAIAESQFLSVATVKATVTRLLVKLSATNRVQVAILVHDAELS